MAKIIDSNSGIQFSVPSDVNAGAKTRIQNKTTIFGDYEDNESVDLSELKFVNAVEIDWNGAQIGEG